MLAGENALEAALKILGRFVPPMAIAEDDLEILIPVLKCRRAGCRQWGAGCHSQLSAPSLRSGEGSAFG
jgi:hypothetical protein